MSDTENLQRQIGSYENACRVLNALALRPDPDVPKRMVHFGEPGWQEEFNRTIAHGVPPPVRVAAFPLPDGIPGRPEVVAEFAAELLLFRTGSRLALAKPGQRPRFSDRANLRWICWGDLIIASNGTRAIAPLAIGPWPGASEQLEPGSQEFTGITTDVLRAIQPDILIRAIVERLGTINGWGNYLAHRQIARNQKEHQRQISDALERARSPRPRDGRSYPDQHYRDIAVLYLNLLDEGHRRRITSQLAALVNVPPATARNWIHRARQLGYLTPARQGQPGAHPGPELNQPGLGTATDYAAE